MIVKDYNPNEISFSITEEAKKQLQKLFKTQTVFLLTVKKMGCSGYAYDLKQISLDELKPEFILIDPEINFYVDENYKNLLNNITMKWNDDSVFQKSFVFENPNAKNTCGCGESFTSQ